MAGRTLAECMCVYSRVWFASVFYCTGQYTGIGKNHVVYFSWHIRQTVLYNALCEPYVCMLFWFPHNVKSYLPQCMQGFITYELNKQANNSFTLKSRLYLLRVEILPWEIIGNRGAFRLVSFWGNVLNASV